MAGSNRLFQTIERLSFGLIVVFIAAYSLFPFIWALFVSFDMGSGSFTLAHYNAVFTGPNSRVFLISIWNSILVCGIVTLLSLFLGSLSAYALGRYKFRGRYLVRYMILATTIFPTISVLPSLLTRIKALGLPGVLSELMLVYPLFILPSIIWQLITFFERLHPEIEEAAFVDGATAFETFVHILLPITMPVLVTFGLLSFLALLNEYLFALSFGADQSQLMIPVALSRIRASGASQEVLMAASIVVTIPILVIVLFLQGAIIGNTTEGAVKG